MTDEDGFDRRDTGAVRFGWWKTVEHFCFPGSAPIAIRTVPRSDREAIRRSRDLVLDDLRFHTKSYRHRPVIAVDFGDGWRYAYKAQRFKLVDSRVEFPNQPPTYNGVRDEKTENRGELGDLPPREELLITPRYLGETAADGPSTHPAADGADSEVKGVASKDEQLIAHEREPGGEEVLTVSQVGAGFGDPDSNRLVEAAAVREVSDCLEARGYVVTDVGSQNLGWDLTCVGDEGDIRRVEVKGVSGTKPTVLLTANEYRSAHETGGWELAVVTAALASPCLTFYSAADAVAAAAPMVYRVTLPRVEGQ